MEKEDYLKIRNLDNISEEDLFSFYKELGGIADFSLFQKFLHGTCKEEELFVMTNKGGKIMSKEIAKRKFKDYYDNKFKI